MHMYIYIYIYDTDATYLRASAPFRSLLSRLPPELEFVVCVYCCVVVVFVVFDMACCVLLLLLFNIDRYMYT